MDDRYPYLHLSWQDYGTCRRYGLWRNTDKVVEIERRPQGNRLEIRMAQLIGLAPEQPTIDATERHAASGDEQSSIPIPADADFSAAFCREINTIYEPDWFDLPNTPGVHRGRLNDVELATMLV